MSKPVIVMSVVDQHRDNFFNDQAFARLNELGDLRLDPDPAAHATPESRAVLAEAEVIITCWGTGSFDALLDQMPNLKLVVHSAGTVRRIIGIEAFDHGVRIASQTQVNAYPVAEYSLAMIILAAKGIFKVTRRYHELRDKPANFWDEFPEVGLYGAKIGLIGLSKISRHLIKLLEPFNVEIFVQSGHLSEAEAQALGVTPASVEEICRTCDIVSLHSALTDRSRGTIRGEHFAMMKDGATFINSARGAITNQEEMIAELKKDRIYAIIDHTDPEVAPADWELWDLPNVFLSPHAAGSTGRETFRLGDGAVADVAAYVNGEPIAGEFDRDAYASRA